LGLKGGGCRLSKTEGKGCFQPHRRVWIGVRLWTLMFLLITRWLSWNLLVGLLMVTHWSRGGGLCSRPGGLAHDGSTPADAGRLNLFYPGTL
jgi:hypothetical protein